MNGVADTDSTNNGLRDLLNSLAPKKSRRPLELAAISQTNTEIVGELVEEARKLAKNGKKQDANRLADIAQKVLDNNRKLQDTVGDMLRDAD